MKAADRPPEPLFPDPEGDDLSSHANRQLIGALGLALPFLLVLIAGLRPIQGLPRWTLLTSVSAYYHTGAVAVLVGILIALAVFLFSYQGYENVHRWRDRAAAIIAGGAAVLVAFFPAGAPIGILGPSWWTTGTGTIHNVAAVVLFGAFIFFALVQFPKSKVKKGDVLPLGKQVRNGIHVFCGAAMAICIGWAGGPSFTGAPIFWPEALALVFFAVSWLVKGRVDRTAVAATKQTLHYGRHPGQLVRDVRSAIRG